MSNTKDQQNILDFVQDISTSTGVAMDKIYQVLTKNKMIIKALIKKQAR